MCAVVFGLELNDLSFALAVFGLWGSSVVGLTLLGSEYAQRILRLQGERPQLRELLGFHGCLLQVESFL